MNNEHTIQETIEESTMEETVSLVSLKAKEQPFNSPYFSEKNDNFNSLLNIQSTSESSISLQQSRNSEEILGTSPTIGSDAVIIRGWRNVGNISARLIEFYDTVVVLECLIDKELGIYEEREFRLSLFSEGDLKIGNLFYLRIFERKYESRIEIHSDPKLTFIEDFPKMDFKRFFEKSKLFKK